LVGPKLAFRLTKRLGGHWVWADNRLATDALRTQTDIDKAIEKAWSDQPEVYKHLEGVRQDPSWSPPADACARFVAQGLSRDYKDQIGKILSKDRSFVGSAYVERIHEIGPQVVQGIPSLSISIASRLVYREDLHEYARHLANPDELIGLWVADKNSSLKGEIVDIVGQLRDHRSRLIQLSQNEETIEMLRKSPDDVLVVRVGRNQYDYAATCLRLTIHSEYMQKFGIDRGQMQRLVRIEPKLRHATVNKIAGLLRMNGIIGFQFDSSGRPDLFLGKDTIGLDSQIRLGDGTVVPYGKDIMTNLQHHGLYRRSAKFKGKTAIRMGVVKTPAMDLNPFYRTLQNATANLGFDLELAAEVVSPDQSRASLERAINQLQQSEPHLILGVFPEGPGYYSFKSLTIGRGIASQQVRPKTLEKPYAIANIVLGILSKTGNIPYVLAKPLPYADIVVGIDIAREAKKRLAGSINVAAIARIYFSNGEFVRYVIHDEPIEGETIPVSVLQSMFPANEFEEKRVVVHRDGFFRGYEKGTLKEWAKQIDAEIHLVEVIKSNQPRLYGASGTAQSSTTVSQPPMGAALKLNPSEAIVVSTLPPFEDATPQPLRIRSDDSLPIEQAVHSVLSLTYLHYGSLRPPRLPVTIHYSDRIAGLALRGVKPKNLEGSDPYWL